MSPALADFLFEAVNFLILAAVLGRVLFNPVRRSIDAERERREAQGKETERLQAEADALREQAQRSRQTAEKEAEGARQQILLQAKKDAAALLEEARRTRQDERQALEEELEARRQAQAAALADTVGRLAADAVRALLSELGGPSLDTALVRAACDELASFSAEARKAARVESARPLDDEQKALLVDALDGPFEERVVPELGAGIRVTTSSGQVDATAVSLARHAHHVVREQGPSPRQGPRRDAHDG